MGGAEDSSAFRSRVSEVFTDGANAESPGTQWLLALGLTSGALEFSFVTGANKGLWRRQPGSAVSGAGV